MLLQGSNPCRSAITNSHSVLDHPKYGCFVKQNKRLMAQQRPLVSIHFRSHVVGINVGTS